MLFNAILEQKTGLGFYEYQLCAIIGEIFVRQLKKDILGNPTFKKQF